MEKSRPDLTACKQIVIILDLQFPGKDKDRQTLPIIIFVQTHCIPTYCYNGCPGMQYICYKSKSNIILSDSIVIDLITNVVSRC